MRADERTVAAAFAYAWWLTGDVDAATSAVREATGTAADGGGASGKAALLAAVRRHAIAARTLCPASELALLHDGHGVELDVAADLTGVDAADARVELAHGRLEALVETVRDDFAHPERLGGLAVGHPPDVAHARQCESCASVRDLLARGRRELSSVAAVPPPPGLAAALRLPPAPAADRPAPPASAPRAPAAPQEPAAPPGLTPLFVGAAVFALCVVVLLLALSGRRALHDSSTLDETPPPAQAAGAEGLELGGVLGGPRAPAADPATLENPAQDAVAPPPPATGFAVENAGVLLPDRGRPAASGAVLRPTEPIRFSVVYRGATEGVALEAEWTVNDNPFRNLRVVLSGAASRHVFGATVPEGGWPPGRHRAVLSSDGEIVAAIDFVVR